MFPGHVGQLSCALSAYRWRPSVTRWWVPWGVLLFSFPVTHHPTISSISPLMSHTRPTSASSSNFQLIFDNALRVYQRRTKKVLRNHPLAAQLQDCSSPSNILDLLQQQVEELNQSQLRDENWTKWLDPTVKVLHAFSMTLGERVTSVCLRLSTCRRSAPSYLVHRHFHRQKQSLLRSASSFWCVSFHTFVQPIMMRLPLRQLRMSVQVKMLFLRSLIVLKHFSDDWRFTLKRHWIKEW